MCSIIRLSVHWNDTVCKQIVRTYQQVVVTDTVYGFCGRFTTTIRVSAPTFKYAIAANLS